MPNTIKPSLDQIKLINEYLLFDTPNEEQYDNLTFLASQICNTPISTITLIDTTRQWFKSKIGFTHNENPIEYSFCALALSKNLDFLEIPNLMLDEEFSGIGKLNGLKENGFYASVAIRNEKGIPLATLCVIDYESKKLTNDQKKGLQILGKQVEELFKLRLKNATLLNNYKLLSEQYETLKQFSNRVSHDIQSPLNNIISLITLFREENETSFSSSEYLQLMIESSSQLKEYVTKLLYYYRSENQTIAKKIFAIQDIITTTNSILNPKKEFKIISTFEKVEIYSDPLALTQIVMNLVSNGLKYNYSTTPAITFGFKETATSYELKISDNGIGLSEIEAATLIDNAASIAKKDRFGNYGTQLGWTTIKNLCSKIGATITIHSKLNEGSTFILLIPKDTNTVLLS
ncbi:HAMP domain-containing sensor histidine kinase [Flavobacterium polysaccharolyticum]|uniref:histidine kinase n=1 Tax=Flavobacterium polysaccharolyticum TaxID=3133148 RepID=A0ABU9NRD2_9FLAO